MTDDDPESVRVLNLWAVAGLVVAGVVGVAGLFSLPVVRSYGVGVRAGFLIAVAIEGVAAGIAVLSVRHLHVQRV